MIDLARLFQKYTVCNRPGAAIELTEQDLRAIEEAVSKISVLGDRYPLGHEPRDPGAGGDSRRAAALADDAQRRAD